MTEFGTKQVVEKRVSKGSATPPFQGAGPSTPNFWTLDTRDGTNLQFSTEIAVYLGNSTRYAHGFCYRKLLEIHR